MTANEEALQIFNQVKKEGLSTDYCYSPDFKKKCIELAVNRAKRKCINNVEDVINEIKKLENV